MRRRALLSVFAGGATGCLGPGSSTAPPSPTKTATAEDIVERTIGESYTVDGGVDVTLSDPSFEKSFVAYYEPHYEIRTVEGWQFVVVDVDFGGERPEDFVANPWEEATLHPVVDGDRRGVPAPAMYQRGNFGTVIAGLGVPFPVVEAESAAVAWERSGGPTVRWTLDEATVEGLARAPRFEVEAFDVTVRGERIEQFAATVANRGDRDGEFRALLRMPNRDADPVLEFDVPAGERTTYEDISTVATPRYVVKRLCENGTDVDLVLSPDRTVAPTLTCATPTVSDP